MDEAVPDAISAPNHPAVSFSDYLAERINESVDAPDASNLARICGRRGSAYFRMISDDIPTNLRSIDAITYRLSARMNENAPGNLSQFSVQLYANPAHLVAIGPVFSATGPTDWQRLERTFDESAILGVGDATAAAQLAAHGALVKIESLNDTSIVDIAALELKVDATLADGQHRSITLRPATQFSGIPQPDWNAVGHINGLLRAWNFDGSTDAEKLKDSESLQSLVLSSNVSPWVPSRIGSTAIEFNGHFSAETTGNVSDLNLNLHDAITVSFWINPTNANPPAPETILGKFTNERGFSISFTPFIVFSLFDGDSKILYHSNAGLGTYEEPQLITIAYDGSVPNIADRVKMWIGEQPITISAATTGTVSNLANSAPLVIGGDGLTAILDDIRIYGQALTPAHIISSTAFQ
jgi:hypothetical protein